MSLSNTICVIFVYWKIVISAMLLWLRQILYPGLVVAQIFTLVPTAEVCWRHRVSQHLSVCPSIWEVSGHFMENAWKEWSQIWCVDVSLPPLETFWFWSWVVDFPTLDTTLIERNGSYLRFPGIFLRTHRRTPVQFVTGFRAVGGDCAMPDALLPLELLVLLTSPLTLVCSHYCLLCRWPWPADKSCRFWWAGALLILLNWQDFVNPLGAKFFRGHINIYLHFMSLLHSDMTHVLNILPRVRPGPTYSQWSISWLLMSWRRKEPGHQQPWYWPS